ncbi:MAG: hypothetical protein COB08_015050 [Rhodobacteraceae bacterium]|nr:hypothetical protein [Paracoccaceae bacterium]
MYVDQNPSIMINIKRLFTKGILATLAFYPQVSTAGGFTSAEVLNRELEAQNSLFLTSIGMVGIVAMQTGQHDDKVDCINDWYWVDGLVSEAKNDAIRVAVESLSQVHPQAVIMAVIERECGLFALN